MVRINQPISAQWQRAAERAAQDRQAGRVARRVACKTYAVASSRPGHGEHTVYIDSLVNLVARCDCEAGQQGIPCRHAAAALCEAARHIARCERERATAPKARYVDATAEQIARKEIDRLAAMVAR